MVERARTASRSARIIALATGTMGLIAVGMLALAVTPRRHSAPVAISATTSPHGLFGTTEVTARALPPRETVSVPPLAGIGVARPPAATAPTERPSVTVLIVGSALATPVGDGRLALVTDRSLDGQHAGRISVRLTTGEEMTGQIMSASGGATVISIDRSEPGHQISDSMPSPSDLVTVLAVVPVDVRFADVATLNVPEGTPIIDDAGQLVGLCSEMPDGSTDLILAEPAIAPLDATTSVAP